MNLLHDPWMPVRGADGQRHWITPSRLAEPQWRAFDADRPDFNGALAQFAIGLLQTTTPVGDSIEWRGLLNAPPNAATLQGWFEPVASAFELDGDGPRFMQDFGLVTEPGKVSPVPEILIDAPGESSLDANKDFFVKRGVVSTLCTDCAAAAVLTLQVNAPEGGRGHFTGLRGGGPLTTLVIEADETSLWRHLWMNVIERDAGARDSPNSQSVFPWLSAVESLQRPGGSVTSAQADHLHAFWAMPRRIRLDFTTSGEPIRCSLCERMSSRTVSDFRSRPNGLNYPSNAWRHPLTPYREKEGTWLPIRPKSDGLGYRHWLAWVLAVGESATQRAKVVDWALVHRQRQIAGGLRLWSFGYEMRKDKAVAWHESTLPLYHLAACDKDQQHLIQSEVARWLAGAELASMYLRGCVKDAWFGGNARGDFAHIDAAFWSATEPAFYRHLQSLIEAARSATEHPALPVREAWHTTLRNTALRLFDTSLVGAGTIERQNPRRIALAHKQLRNSLFGPKLRSALGLPVDAPKPKPARKSAGKSIPPKSTSGPAGEAA